MRYADALRAAQVVVPMLTTLPSCAGVDTGGPHDGQALPVEPQAIERFLREGAYESWHAWSAVGPTLGTRGARVYLNAALAESLAAGNEVHPLGAAAVRELYADDFETLVGYSALAKVDASAQPESWFWLEVLDVEAGWKPAVSGVGAERCVGCHGQSIDYVRSVLPLP